jgi:hypothetical protein
VTADPRSRYFGLPAFVHEGHLTSGLRRIEPRDEPERFVLHRLSDAETLDLLALRYYGREDLWWRIADANAPMFPLDFRPGDVLRVPLGPFARKSS